jgi:hypothetical protein
LPFVDHLALSGQYSICTRLELQQYAVFVKSFVTKEMVAHKIVHTFGKLDAINPTFEVSRAELTLDTFI